LSIFDDEARISLSGEFESGMLRDIGDSTSIFRMLAETYPASGSKVAWSKVPGAISERFCCGDQEVEQFVMFIRGQKLNSMLSTNVTYVGDNATDAAVEGSQDGILSALPKLINVAQHHYLIGPGCSWCACLTMEGDMHFGFAPSQEVTASKPSAVHGNTRLSK
jgi:hypothetical protein